VKLNCRKNSKSLKQHLYSPWLQTSTLTLAMAQAADKFSALSTCYFGHHSANRVELSRGRDLVVEPGPASGPINFLAYPFIEIEGKPAKAQILFSFRRRMKSMQTSANP
jgi:hypothetical protein